jgi:hypothetical protein
MMTKRFIVGASVLLVGAAACGKSNPASPSMVSFASPASATAMPADGSQIKFLAQPVTLMTTNGVATGSAALTYTFEVATDEGFTSKTYSKDAVAEGAGGQTSLVIDKLAGAKTYFWRVRSNAAGAAGPYSKTRSFTIGPEIVIQAPVLSSPGANEEVNETPTLTVINAQRTGPAGTIFYRFEVAATSDFANLVYSATVQERGDLPYTPHQITQKLAADTLFWWRVIATDPANDVSSPYSGGNPFKVVKQFDLRNVTIVLGAANIANWQQTATISDAYFDPAQRMLCIFHSRLGIWPGTAFFGDRGTLVEGNQWVFMQQNGKWYGGAADWYRPSQACKGIDANSIGRDAFYRPTEEPLHSWVPQSGELFGVMSSTPARAWPYMSTYDERTDVKLIRWP